MTITTRAGKGSALSHSELDANFTDLDTRMGFVDYNDLATTSAPIALTTPGTFYPLTNDEAGSATNKTYAIPGLADLWDESSNSFDFSPLSLGDVVTIRYDVEVTTTGANREVELDIVLGIGGSSYSLAVDREYFKTAGTYSYSGVTFIYMGNSNTKDNPARFEIMSDSAGTTVTVNGWAVKTELGGF